MDRLKKGIHDYRRDVFPQQKELLERLAKEGQKPHTLVIACSDSRVRVTEWTGADPGEFFVIRNAGNIVPPWDSVEHSGVTASIEYAIRVLPIENVIIAGHSHCGAITAVLKPEQMANMPSVRKWLDHAQNARTRAEQKFPDSDDTRKLRKTIAENVLLQVENLKTFPCVQEKVAAGTIKIFPWVVEFETGNVWEYDTATEKWGVLE
ncbi:MAG: carbonic anhydrase [Planctomycetes bacterium]|nr:carbonic anhydrase [Planctomycetota bacterium]